MQRWYTKECRSDSDSDRSVKQDGEAAGQSVPHVHVHLIPRCAEDFPRNDEVYERLEDFDYGSSARSAGNSGGMSCGQSTGRLKIPDDAERVNRCPRCAACCIVAAVQRDTFALPQTAKRGVAGARRKWQRRLGQCGWQCCRSLETFAEPRGENSSTGNCSQFTYADELWKYGSLGINRAGLAGGRSGPHECVMVMSQRGRRRELTPLKGLAL